MLILTVLLLIAAIITTFISYKMLNNTQHNKNRNERKEMFSKIADFMARIYNHEEPDTSQFLRDTKGAQLIFDKKIKCYIDKVYANAMSLFTINRDITLDPKNKENQKKRRNLIDWFTQELNKIENKFQKYFK